MELALIALVVLVAQTVRGIAGFGSALLTVPVVATLWSPAEAVLLATALDLVGGAVLLSPEWRRLRASLIAAVVLAMIPGQIVGTWLLLYLSDDTARLIVGVVVALLGLDAVLWPVRVGRGELDDLPRPAGPVLREGAGVGALAGLFQGVVGTPGPPIVWFARRHFTASFLRAQLIAIFFFGGLPLITTLSVGGASTPSLWTSALLLCPLVLVGAVVGARLAPRVPRVAFGRLVGVMLVAAAAMLIRGALTG